MKSKYLIPALFFLLLPVTLLAGCSNPSSRSKITPTINITQARQTVEARLTQVAGTPLSSLVPPASPTFATTQAVQTPVPTSLASPVMPTSTLIQTVSNPSPTTNALPTADIACDRAAPGYPTIDVTIDDDTQMAPGNSFTKIWRLSNQGSCTWTKDYAAVWFSGERLGDVINVPLGREVAPGENVDISADMVAPTTAGTYQSNWKLRNAGGVLFGIGPNGDAPFWVRIIVVQTGTNTPTATPTPTLTPSATFEPTLEPTATATFAPTLTSTLAPPIQVSGSVTLAPGETIDLETGQKNTGADDDLAYQDNEAYHQLAPLAGTVLGVYGSQDPTLEACQSAGMSAAPIAVESLSTGVYLCYRTPQGLPGRLRLNRFNSEVSSISLDYLTWAAP
jgi:Ig-like domain from next to BRCA1 gene